jgi:hypothetical protein
MATPVPFEDYFTEVFGKHENHFVYWSADPRNTPLQKGLIDAFLLFFDTGSRDLVSPELQSIVRFRNQYFLTPPEPRCEGLHAFHLGTYKGNKLSPESQQLLDTVYEAFPEAKTTGVLMIHDENLTDLSVQAAGDKAFKKLIASFVNTAAPKKTPARSRR